MTIATLAQVKAALGIDHTDDDDRLTALLGVASDRIERFTGVAFSQAERTEYLRGGEPMLQLRYYPVAESPAPVVTDQLAGGATVTGWRADYASGMIWRRTTGDACWSEREGRWKVVYTGGYDDAPDDVKGALYDIVAHDMKAQGGLESEKDGDYSYKLASSSSAFPASAMAVLSRYRRNV